MQQWLKDESQIIEPRFFEGFYKNCSTVIATKDLVGVTTTVQYKNQNKYFDNVFERSLREELLRVIDIGRTSENHY